MTTETVLAQTSSESAIDASMPSTAPWPYTGTEHLDSVNDGREVRICGDRVNNMADHPRFRKCTCLWAAASRSLDSCSRHSQRQRT